MKRNIFIFLIVLFAGLVSAIHFQPASADMAPPPPASGSDLYPSIENTNVRMVSETVLMDIAGYSENPLGEAQVTAQFFMRNMGEVTEQMQARFPLNSPDYILELELKSGDEFCTFIDAPAVYDFSVWVNDEKVDSNITFETILDFRASNPDTGDVYITVPCWAHFDIVFPPGQDVSVKVSYTISGYDPSSRAGGVGNVEYFYVLRTGAGWYDTIGRADIVARLPYDVTNLNFRSCWPDTCVISGKEIAWHFENFEPEENIEIRIMKPSIWLRILTETENLQVNSNDGESWGRLAKAYKDSSDNGRGQLVVWDDLSAELYSLSKDAYQKATELLPNDADWHYGFADLLCRYAEWNEATREDWAACVQQIKLALDIKPNHEAANELLQYLSLDEKLIDLSGPEPIYLILTPQPTATSTPIPSNTPIPTKPLTRTPENTTTSTTAPISTSAPTQTNPSPTPTHPLPSPTESVSPPADSGSATGFVVVGAGLVVLLLIGLALRRKR